MAQEPAPAVVVLTSTRAEGYRDGRFVVIVKTREEFEHWLREAMPGPEWLQVEGMLGDREVWAMAAQGPPTPALDVVVTNPAAEFASLYRLVDVRSVREVRVTIPAKPGFMKAVRLAAALQLRVRLLPGQPSAEVLSELAEAAQFYLRDPMVETPVEYFHSLLAVFRGMADGTLWDFLEEDPALFSHYDPAGRALHAPDFVETHFARLLLEGAECATCRWQSVCAGYFKWPDRGYGCAGVKQIFATLEAAADEIGGDLAREETFSAP